jgi:hypothetical protein
MFDFIFTRYLYEKEEVGYSLILSLLNKKEEESIFWATELYYSGFEDELYEFLWIIYQNFYASLNSKFEHYLLKKIELLKKPKPENTNKKTDKNTDIDKNVIHLHLIIKNFIIRPYNLDTFSLILLTTDFEIESSTNENENKDHSLKPLLTLTPNYLQIAKLLLDDWREKDEAFIEKNLEYTIDFFNTTFQSIKTMKYIEKEEAIKDFHKTIQRIKSNSFDSSPSFLLLTHTLNLYGKLNKLKMGKNLTLVVPEESFESEINKYKNQEIGLTQPLKSYQLLNIFKMARVYPINPEINNVFKLKRNQSKIDLTTAFREDWLYYASFSPLWKSRIHKYNGSISKNERKVFFEKEEDEEEFYLNYGYEPDEQSKECQEKSIASFTKSKCKEWIEKEYNKSANCLYKIEQEYLDEL